MIIILFAWMKKMEYQLTTLLYIYNIKTKEESLLTGKEPQILPCIGSDWVGWVTSRQVNPVVDIIKYR